MMTTLFIVIGVVFFVQRLAKAVLSPKLPNWRLISVETRAAQAAAVAGFATVAFTGIDVFLSSVYQVLGSPLSLTVGREPGRHGADRHPGDPDRPGQALCRRGRPAAALASAAALQRCIVLGGADDRRRAARLHRLCPLHVACRSCSPAPILATMYIGFLSARAVSEEGAFATHRRSAGGWNAASSSIQTTLDQLALVVSIAINLLIVVIGLPLILFMWGFQPGDIQAWIYKFATEIRIGSVTISLTGILTGILVFVLGYFVSRWFQGWLDGSVHGARPRRCRRAQFDPHRRRLCRHPARRPARRFGGRHRHVEPGAGRRRAVARHRLRPAEHRLQLRLRPDPAGRAAVQGRRLGRRRRRTRAWSRRSACAPPRSRRSSGRR